MSEELSKQVKEERGTRGEECACHKEKTPKYPKWRECGAFWRTEKHPRWWQQGWRWSPRVRTGPSWAGTRLYVLWAQWPKQIKAKTNILSCLPKTCAGETAKLHNFRRLVKTLGILSRRVSAQTPALATSPPAPPASGLRTYRCPPPPSSTPLVPGFLVTLEELLWGWVLKYLAPGPLNECVFLLCQEGYLVFDSSAELSPKPWGGSKQQSLHATELVHHCAPASVSLLNTSRYLLRLEVCPETLVLSVYWVPEIVMECWGWC